MLLEESSLPAHAMVVTVLFGHSGNNIDQAAVGTGLPECLDVAVGSFSLLDSEDKEGGLCSKEYGPSTVQALLVKGSLSMTGQSSIKGAQGFLLGQPRSVKLKPRIEKHFGGLAKDWSRALFLSILEKGLQNSQPRREKGNNEDVCADPLIREWVLGRGLSPFSSSRVSTIGLLVDAGRALVEGHGWEKNVRSKEGLLGGALGEGNLLVKMLFMDGSLLEFPQISEEGPFCNDVVVRFGESDPSKVKSGSCSTRETHPLDGLLNKLTSFSSFVGMPVVVLKMRLSPY